MLDQNINRRDFIQKSAVITAGTLMLPSFLRANNYLTQNGKQLVVIQLSGGNDGLNTIIPYQNDLLHQARPLLAPSKKNVLKLSDEAGLNNTMGDFMRLYDEGDVCILNNVGYPNPNRSHFRSMDIWHSASDANEYWETGWLGRYLDSECTHASKITAVEMGEVLGRAMKGENFKGLPVKNVNQFYQAAKRVKNTSHSHEEHEMASFLHKTISDTQHNAAYLFEKNKIYQSKKTYPQTKFANDLKEVAEMIVSGVESPVYYISLGGFDTHFRQQERQATLLKTYSEALKVFVEDLKQNDQWNNTLVMVFSEFGRRVKQNGSAGTDHGKANNLFVLGGKLKKQGFYNDLPDLSNLDDGDLRHEIDFRQVYATILDKWLETKPNDVLKKNFSTLNFI